MTYVYYNFVHDFMWGYAEITDVKDNILFRFHLVSTLYDLKNYQFNDEFLLRDSILLGEL